MACAPGANIGVMEAVPPELTVVVPSFVVPSVNVTLPVTVAEPVITDTLAVRLTAAPAMAGAGVHARAVVVCVRLTV